MKLLEEIEGERLADCSFMEIKEKLLKNEIPWKKLPPNKSPPLSYPLAAVQLQIPGKAQKTIQRFFTLTCVKEKEGLNGEIYRIFDVNIYFTPRLSNRKKTKKNSEYHFNLTVRKIPIESPTSNPIRNSLSCFFNESFQLKSGHLCKGILQIT
jgi:hypothetical protein